MKNSQKKDVLVVPTTHWDRAWYWTFQRFRIRLIQLFEGVIHEMEKHPEYRFVIDGQAIPVMDYLEALPERKNKIKSLVRAGRLQAGPMFTLPDLFCTGGEAFLRNLLLGEDIVIRLGGRRPKMLYLPDSFGMTADVPMLAAGSGYPVVSFMRELPPEVPKEQRFFFWDGPDGSVVRVFYLRDGYGNACWLGSMYPGCRRWGYDHRKAVSTLIAAAERQDDAQGEPLLLLAGSDHMLPQPQLHQAMLDATAESNYNFRYATLDDLADGVLAKTGDENWLRHRGECRGNGCSHTLGGTVSTRMHLKQANAEIERQLVHVAEPADALCALLGRMDAAGGALRNAWMHLITTHPHDDITGCSVDKVHEDDEYHQDEARDATDAVRRRMAEILQYHFGGSSDGETRDGFILINHQPFRRLCRARLTLDFEGRERWGDAPPPKFYAIVDEKGRETPFVELCRGRSIEHPHQFVEIEVAAELDPFSPCRFFIEPRDQWPMTESRTDMMENERIKVAFHEDGAFDMTDKNSGLIIRRAGLFSDQGDCGDSYDFSDISGDKERIFSGLRFERKTLTACSGAQSIEMSGALPIPDDSDADGRSARTIGLPVRVRLTLFPKDPQLHLEITVVNTAKSHRLRWNAGLPFTVKETRAGQKFSEIRHAVRPQPPEPAMKENYVTGGFDPAEMGKSLNPFRVHPEFTADYFIGAENDRGGYALLTGLPVNYEVVEADGSQRLAVCVLRATGASFRAAATR